MHQSITVHELDPDESIDDIFWTFLSSDLLIGEYSKDRTEPLPSSFHGMTNRIDKLDFY